MTRVYQVTVLLKKHARCAPVMSAGVVDFSRTHGHCIFGRGFRARVASDACSLFAAAHPEPASLPLQGFAGAVEQFDLQRLIGWDLNKERSVASPPAPTPAALRSPRYPACRAEPSGSIRQQTCISRCKHSDKAGWHKASHASPRDAASARCVPQPASAGLHWHSSPASADWLNVARRRPVSTTSIGRESSHLPPREQPIARRSLGDISGVFSSRALRCELPAPAPT